MYREGVFCLREPAACDLPDRRERDPRVRRDLLETVPRPAREVTGVVVARVGDRAVPFKDPGGGVALRDVGLVVGAASGGVPDPSPTPESAGRSVRPNREGN